jgi:hypothetical protein
MTSIWIFRIAMAWLGAGMMAFFAALLIDIWRGAEVGMRYLVLHRRGVALLLFAWPYALALIAWEYKQAEGGR